MAKASIRVSHFVVCNEVFSDQWLLKYWVPKLCTRFLSFCVFCCKEQFNQNLQGYSHWGGHAIFLIFNILHYNDVIMDSMASQITSLTIVYLIVYSRRRSKKTSKLRVTGLCAENSPVTGEFHTQRASNAKNVSIWWRHHEPNKN